MEGVMTILTEKEQTFAGPVGITGMTTHRAGFARIVGIHLDRHTLVQERFVSNHALKLGKAPFGVSGVGLALLDRHLFGAFAILLTTPLAPFVCPRAFSNVCQILQADQA